MGAFSIRDQSSMLCDISLNRTEGKYPAHIQHGDLPNRVGMSIAEHIDI